MTDKDPKNSANGYDSFLSDISQFATKKEERDFMDSITPEPPEEDIVIHVGERVRKVRTEKGLSLQDVSQRTDMDADQISRIEDGEIAPPLGTVIKLAKALEMKLGYFISGDEFRAYTIVRKRDRKVVSRYDSKRAKQYGYEYKSLAPHKKDRHMEPFLVTLEPADTEEERSTHDGQEFIFVLQGSMEVRLGEEIHVLEPGDSIYYDSTVPHLVRCHGRQTTVILAVLYAER
ncbi:MAG: helix-turn-helix transcriptional regulator [Deltaproteobacteria bacterium]|nr:helix-turn-helix transcriptional regulator [Deltaproteobacteria bacterium]